MKGIILTLCLVRLTGIIEGKRDFYIKGPPWTCGSVPLQLTRLNSLVSELSLHNWTTGRKTYVVKKYDLVDLLKV